MTESSGVMAWAYGLLTGDTDIAGLISARVYDSLAPQDTIGDYLILSQQSYAESGTGITGAIGSGHIMLLVKAVTQSAGYATAETLYENAHRVLQGQQGLSNGVTIHSCIRESVLRYVEIRDGKRYNHLGGIYSVYASLQ